MASKYLNRLQGQRVVILGGTSGIGYAIAEASIENSATVIISGSKQDKVDLKVTALQESYPEAAERISGKVCDLSNLEQQESNIVAILDFASNNGAKKLNHIVNTVGDKLHNPPFSELSVEKIQKRLTGRRHRLFTSGQARPYLPRSKPSELDPLHRRLRHSQTGTRLDTHARHRWDAGNAGAHARR